MECRSKRLVGSPRSTNHTEHEVSPDIARSALIKQRPGYDFSQIHRHAATPGPGKVQPKLVTDHPGDPYEQEADRVAGSIVSMSIPSSIRLSSRYAPGNAVQQSPSLAANIRPLASPHLQRAPQTRSEGYEEKITGLRGTLFQKTVRNILVRFFLTPQEVDKEKQIQANLSGVTAQIAKMNALMGDPAYAVQQLFIWTGATTGFRIVLGKPTFYVDTKYIIGNDIGTITHEMGHGIIYSYMDRETSTKEASVGKEQVHRNMLQRLAEIYLQLKSTKKEKLRDLGVTKPELENLVVPVGLFMVDPSNWSRGSEPEHPWDNFDEFFASALEGFITNRKGLMDSIARYAKKDPHINSVRKELVDVLEVFQTKKYPTGGYHLKQKTQAESEIERAGVPPEVKKVHEGEKEIYIYPEVKGRIGSSTPEAPVTPPLLYLVDPSTLERAHLERSSTGQVGPTVIPTSVSEVLQTPGSPLDPSTRTFFEPRFGHDFGKVRVHTDEKAAQSARAVNALAYTVGRHIVFGSAQYRPMVDKRLLAHELVHVVQQDGAAVQGMSAVSNLTDHHEHEADIVADQVLQNDLSGPQTPTPTGLTVARMPDDKPSFTGTVADIVYDIRQRRERRFQRLAQEYQQYLMAQSGIHHRGTIASPQEALQILRHLNVDINQMNRALQEIQGQTANAPTGMEGDRLAREAAQAVAALSQTGRATFDQVLREVKAEPFFHNLLASEEIHIQPDPKACDGIKGYRATSEGSEPVPGAERAKPLKTTIHLCQNFLEKGDVATAKGTLAHELSHVAETIYAGQGTAELVTDPVVEELTRQLAQLPEYRGKEELLTHFLYRKIGGYPQKEIFAKLQQLPQSPGKMRSDVLQREVVCELRRLDTSGLPDNIRKTLLDDLRVRTEAFYAIRIRMASGNQAKELEQAREYAIYTLEQAQRVRELERLGEPAYELKCKE